MRFVEEAGAKVKCPYLRKVTTRGFLYPKPRHIGNDCLLNLHKDACVLWVWVCLLDRFGGISGIGGWLFNVTCSIVSTCLLNASSSDDFS